MMQPKSKLSSYNSRETISGHEDTELHHLYRLLDILADSEDDLKDYIFEQQKRLSNQELDVVLFDVTTLYFESCKEDDLRRFGFSKDCKFGEVQIVLSLMVSAEGKPLGYEIFPGNSFEGNTLITSIMRLKENYKIKKITIVADRGMSSIGNLSNIKKAGFDFCVAFRIKNASKKLQEQILEEENYKEIAHHEDSLRYKTMKNGDGKLLCIHSNKRAQKDKSDREKMLKKAEEMHQNGSYRRKNGAKKYLKIDNESSSGVSYEKAEKDSIYDGFYAINYSDPSAKPGEILLAYHNLWRIEENFRTMNASSGLEITR